MNSVNKDGSACTNYHLYFVDSSVQQHSTIVHQIHPPNCHLLLRSETHRIHHHHHYCHCYQNQANLSHYWIAVVSISTKSTN